MIESTEMVTLEISPTSSNMRQNRAAKMKAMKDRKKLLSPNSSSENVLDATLSADMTNTKSDECSDCNDSNDDITSAFNMEMLKLDAINTTSPLEISSPVSGNSDGRFSPAADSLEKLRSTKLETLRQTSKLKSYLSPNSTSKNTAVTENRISSLEEIRSRIKAKNSPTNTNSSISNSNNSHLSQIILPTFHLHSNHSPYSTHPPSRHRTYTLESIIENEEDEACSSLKGLLSAKSSKRRSGSMSSNGSRKSIQRSSSGSSNINISSSPISFEKNDKNHIDGICVNEEVKDLRTLKPPLPPVAGNNKSPVTVTDGSTNIDTVNEAVVSKTNGRNTNKSICIPKHTLIIKNVDDKESGDNKITNNTIITTTTTITTASISKTNNNDNNNSNNANLPNPPKRPKSIPRNQYSPHKKSNITVTVSVPDSMTSTNANSSSVTSCHTTTTTTTTTVITNAGHSTNKKADISNDANIINKSRPTSQNRPKSVSRTKTNNLSKTSLPTSQQQIELCKFYSVGRICRFGSNCHFIHSTSNETTTTSTSTTSSSNTNTNTNNNNRVSTTKSRPLSIPKSDVKQNKLSPEKIINCNNRSGISNININSNSNITPRKINTSTVTAVNSSSNITPRKINTSTVTAVNSSSNITPRKINIIPSATAATDVSGQVQQLPDVGAAKDKLSTRPKSLTRNTAAFNNNNNNNNNNSLNNNTYARQRNSNTQSQQRRNNSSIGSSSDNKNEKCCIT